MVLYVQCFICHPDSFKTFKQYVRLIYTTRYLHYYFSFTQTNPIYSPLQQKHVHVSSLPNYPNIQESKYWEGAESARAVGDG